MEDSGRAIICRGLTRSFANGRSVTDLDLDVEPGEVLALLGPNGAGKTTTVRLLDGVLRPDRGEARVLGLDPWTDGDELRRRTGVLTEHAGLDDRFTARENLIFAARIRKLDPVASARRADELLDRLGMTERADSVIRGTSTGERKRVALARAMLHRPDVLFLDEPTSGLDPTASRAVVEMIAGLAAEEGRTIVLCTHHLAEAGRLADRMAVLVEGRLRAEGTPAQIAADLGRARVTEVDLGGPAEAHLLAAVDAALARQAAEGAPASTRAAPSPKGVQFESADRSAVPAVVAALVGHGAEVYGVTTQEPSLEDVYFEVEARELAGLGSSR